MESLPAQLREYRRLGVADQVDHARLELYTLVAHSTALEGSTLTPLEAQLLIEEGISPAGRGFVEQLMNFDLHDAYEEARRLARSTTPLSVELLRSLAARVMKNTGSLFHTPLGDFDAARGELRLLNVTAGVGGPHYLPHEKVPQQLRELCQHLNQQLAEPPTEAEPAYELTFLAHLRLVTIHPWVDGNGRMARLLMHMLQWRLGLPPTRLAPTDRHDYIATLRTAQSERHPDTFLHFMTHVQTRNLREEIAQQEP